MRTSRSVLRRPTRRVRWPACTIAPTERGWWDVQDASRRRVIGTFQQYRSALSHARSWFAQR